MWLGQGRPIPERAQRASGNCTQPVRSGRTRGGDGRNRVKSRAMSPAAHRSFFPRLRGRETLCGACFTPCLAGSPLLPHPTRRERRRAFRSLPASRSRPARPAAGTRCILVFRPVLQPRRGPAPQRVACARGLFLPWPYVCPGLVSRLLVGRLSLSVTVLRCGSSGATLGARSVCSI